jgi:hypothetical protein
MAQFMIDVSIPAEPNTEFLALIPAQRAHIEELLEQGTVTAYSLSLDRSKLWIMLVPLLIRDLVFRKAQCRSK